MAKSKKPKKMSSAMPSMTAKEHKAMMKKKGK